MRAVRGPEDFRVIGAPLRRGDPRFLHARACCPPRAVDPSLPAYPRPLPPLLHVLGIYS
jgi:hypothetical protein